MKRCILYLVLTSACFTQGAILDWLYYPFQIFSGKSEQTSLYSLANDDAVLHSVQFEADSEYDTFLSEAQTVIDIKLSELEVCQHKVIMKIKSSCATLTDEDLAKLSVNLLNCKSSEEGGKQFICTSRMSIEECTANMDSEMWNAYRVMHDKSRSLCFSVRQQLFKATTEMVVNKLMHSSQDQMKSMKALQDGHRMMLQQQDALREAQDAVSASLKSHVHSLEKEKALVIAGHDEVAKIVEGMHRRLDEASSQMDVLLKERKTNHNRLVKNINVLQAQVKELLQQINHSVRLVKEQNEEIAAKYKDAIENLAQINSTVHYLVEILEMAQNELDAWVKWISSLLGGTGDHVAVMLAFLLHLGYMLLGMVAMAFLGAPFSSRLLLLVLVPVNLLLVVNQGNAARKVFPYTLESLDFRTMTLVIFTFTLGSLIATYIFNFCKTTIWANKSPESSWNSAKGNHFVKMSPVKRVPQSGVDVQSCWYRKLANGLKALDPRSWWASDEEDLAKESWSKGLSSPASQAYKSDIDDSSDTDGPLVIEKDDDDDYYAEVYNNKNFEPALNTSYYQKSFLPEEYTSALLQDNLRRSSTSKTMCSATCQSGQPCRNSCINGLKLCHRHSLGIPSRN